MSSDAAHNFLFSLGEAQGELIAQVFIEIVEATYGNNPRELTVEDVARKWAAIQEYASTLDLTAEKLFAHFLAGIKNRTNSQATTIPEILTEFFLKES